MFPAKKTFLSFALICILSLFDSKAEVAPKSNHWVDSLMQTMTLKQKIAQLFMVSAYSNKNDAHTQEIHRLVSEYDVGGLCFFQGSPKKQVELTNIYQSAAKVPLLISMDAEWGVGMRLDSVLLFPKQMALGSIRHPEMIYKMGQEVARQFKALGMHVNFAPVVDVNNNPMNPVINTRSFGEDREEVAKRSILYMKGMQDEGILACAKHFPGHGDTHVDSHFDLPVLEYSRKRLDSLELYPFKKIIRAGVNSVMVGHLFVPSIEPEQNIPASLSQKAIQGLLQHDLRFKGIVFSDGMQMKAISNRFPAPKANLMALKAGCDMLVFPTQVIESIDTIAAAVSRNELKLEEVEIKCRKILMAKYHVGLNRFQPLPTEQVTAFLNRQEAKALQETLVEASFVLLKNDAQLLPLSNSSVNGTVYLEIGKQQGNSFYNRLSDYARIPRIRIAQHRDSLKVKLDSLRPFHTLIIAYHDLSEFPQRNFKIDTGFARSLSELLPKANKCLVLFGTPYALTRIPNHDAFQSMLVCYNNQDLTQEKAAQAVMGGIPIEGIQPVGKKLLAMTGTPLRTQAVRMSYRRPYTLGIKEEALERLDSLVFDALDKKAFPGCQVLAAYDGSVFFHKAYGTLSYTDTTPVSLSTVYDIASISKVTGTLGVIMHLTDRNILQINAPLKAYLSALPESKKDIKLKELLAHQAGLIAWEPYYSRFLTSPDQMPLFAETSSENYPFQIGKRWAYKNAIMHPAFFRDVASPQFPVRMGDRLYANPQVKDSIYAYMDQSASFPKEYKYSDLSFLYLQRVIEAKTNQSLDAWCDSLYFSRLHMPYTAYNPMVKALNYRIAPTSYDPLFRKQILNGYVDDNNAALLGGVAGHAGLFSTCNDLAKYYQMLLWKGHYGGEAFLSEETVKQFTAQAYKNSNNRRSPGFDKPETHKGRISPVPEILSSKSYGHTGFTGCMVWNDPSRKLLFIFLSNRVHPDPSNGKLSKLNTRTEILRHLAQLIDQTQMQ